MPVTSIAGSGLATVKTAVSAAERGVEREVMIYNGGGETLLVAVDGTATTSLYSLPIPAGEGQDFDGIMARKSFTVIGSDGAMTGEILVTVTEA